MVLPFAVVQRVALTCPSCGLEQTRLAASVQKGKRARCDRCRKPFIVQNTKTLIGSARR